MKKVSIVRFASSEKLLDEYMSLRPVLVKVVQDPMFSTCYSSNNEMETQRRKTNLVDPIINDRFLMTISEIHKIFQACRSYLRASDAEAVWPS